VSAIAPAQIKLAIMMASASLSDQVADSIEGFLLLRFPLTAKAVPVRAWPP
jgi:hypothetical protein